MRRNHWIRTDTDFESLSWHDCQIWAVELRPGNPDEGDWTSDLLLDIDFIVEWVCGVHGANQFQVAPATLVFHGATDLRIAIDWGRSGHQAALQPASIDRIEREPIRDQKVYLDRPYFRWKLCLNWPESGEIAFGAFGFTQTLRAKPVLTDKQCLSRSERDNLGSNAKQP